MGLSTMAASGRPSMHLPDRFTGAEATTECDAITRPRDDSPGRVEYLHGREMRLEPGRPDDRRPAGRATGRVPGLHRDEPQASAVNGGRPGEHTAHEGRHDGAIASRPARCRYRDGLTARRHPVWQPASCRANSAVVRLRRTATPPHQASPAPHRNPLSTPFHDGQIAEPCPLPRVSAYSSPVNASRKPKALFGTEISTISWALCVPWKRRAAFGTQISKTPLTPAFRGSLGSNSHRAPPPTSRSGAAPSCRRSSPGVFSPVHPMRPAAPSAVTQRFLRRGASCRDLAVEHWLGGRIR